MHNTLSKRIDLNRRGRKYSAPTTTTPMATPLPIGITKIDKLKRYEI